MINIPKFRFNTFSDKWKTIKLGKVFKQTINYVNPKLQNIELWSLTVEKGLTPKTERYNRSFLVKKENQFKAVSDGEFIYNPMNITLGAIDLNKTGIQVAVSGYYVTMKIMNDFDKNYFNVWLKLPLAINLYKSYATGSLIEKQRVQFPTFSLVSATVPEIDEQKKIGSFFKDLDDTIALHQQELDALKQTKQGFLQKMFPKEGQSQPEIRFKEFLSPWKEYKLSDLSKVTTGKAFKSTDFNSNGEYLVITNKNIQDEENEIISKGDRINISNKVVLDKYLLNEKNILITMDGVNIGKTGRFSNNKAVLAQRVGRINAEQFEFIYQITKSPKFLSTMNQISVGNAIKHISLQQIADYSFMAPTEVAERLKIGEFFKDIDELILLAEKKIKGLQSTKKGFLQKMFV